MGLSLSVELPTTSLGVPLRLNGFVVTALISLGVVVAYSKYGSHAGTGMRRAA
jgi:hypothetical protein